MSISRIAKTLMAGAMVLALAGPATADDEGWGWGHRGGMGPMMGGWGMGHMMGPWGGGPMMGYGPDAMTDRLDGRLAFLKAELKITDAQKEAWDGLASAIRTTSESHVAMMRSMMEEMHSGTFSKKTLPERLAYRQTHIEARLEEIKTVSEAVDKLYVLLDDDQKKTADRMALPMMGMGPGMGMGGGMGPWMMH